MSLGVDALGGVEVRLSVLLGATRARVADLLAYDRGTVVALDAKAGEPVTLLANGTPLASGDIVEQDDGSLAIELRELIRGEPNGQAP